MEPGQLSVALVILCGGAGSRMGGAPKPLLARAHGPPLIAETLAALGPRAEETWLSTTETWAKVYARAICAPQVLDPGRGPARALQEAARVVRTEWILLVGGDQIGVGAGALAALIAHAGKGVSAVVPARDRPLPGLYRAAAIRAIDEDLSDRSLRSVAEGLAALEARDLEIADINTWSDADREGYQLPGSSTARALSRTASS